MMKSLQRGFTLIELLVVIAIIGILAAVVIGSLNDARQGGQDASIQQTMTNVRSQAELYYNSDGDFAYDGVCLDSNVTSGVYAALAVVNATSTQYTNDETTQANADPAVSGNRQAVCVDNSNAYQITVPLADGENFWCIDSTGNSSNIGNVPPAGDAVACP